ERLPPGCGFFSERHPQHREPARCERLQVAQRLRLLEDREAVGLAWDGHIARVVLDYLEEEPDLRAALVELAGGVKEAWAVARRGGVASGVADRRPDGRDRRL